MRYKTAKTAVEATGDAALAAVRAYANVAEKYFKARAAYDTARAHYDDALAEAEATARVRDS